MPTDPMGMLRALLETLRRRGGAQQSGGQAFPQIDLSPEPTYQELVGDPPEYEPVLGPGEIIAPPIQGPRRGMGAEGRFSLLQGDPGPGPEPERETPPKGLGAGWRFQEPGFERMIDDPVKQELLSMLRNQQEPSQQETPFSFSMGKPRMTPAPEREPTIKAGEPTVFGVDPQIRRAFELLLGRGGGR